MPTVNFSIPDDVKEAFDRTFGDTNKSAVIARLMRQPVAGAQREGRRAKLFRRLTGRRSIRRLVNGDEIRKTREANRSRRNE